MYNIVDRICIGHIPGAGAAALTGLGLFVPILMLITAFAMLIGAGGAPLAAIRLGQARLSLMMAALRKLVLLIPLILILPQFFSDKVFAVFISEPVSDAIAAVVTCAVFFTRIDGIPKVGPDADKQPAPAREG